MKSPRLTQWHRGTCKHEIQPRLLEGATMNSSCWVYVAWHDARWFLSLARKIFASGGEVQFCSLDTWPQNVSGNMILSLTSICFWFAAPKSANAHPFPRRTQTQQPRTLQCHANSKFTFEQHCVARPRICSLRFVILYVWHLFFNQGSPPYSAPSAPMHRHSDQLRSYFASSTFPLWHAEFRFGGWDSDCCILKFFAMIQNNSEGKQYRVWPCYLLACCLPTVSTSSLHRKCLTGFY